MKRLVVALATIFAAAVMVSSATAEGPLFELRGFGCGVIDRDGSGIGTDDSYIIWRDSGEVYLRCEAQGTPGANKVQFTGFPCGLGPFGLASNSKNTIGRNGHIQLTCTTHVNPNDVIDTASGGGYGAG